MQTSYTATVGPPVIEASWGSTESLQGFAEVMSAAHLHSESDAFGFAKSSEIRGLVHAGHERLPGRDSTVLRTIQPELGQRLEFVLLGEVLAVCMAGLRLLRPAVNHLYCSLVCGICSWIVSIPT